MSANEVRPMTCRFGVSALCLLLVLQALSGCAGMSEEQKGGATGAGIGAVVGAVTGALVSKKQPAQGAAIGAAAGALVGGVAGWAIGAYRVKQVKPREEAAAAANYTPQQGVVTKIDRVAATPQQIKPGDQLTFQSRYTVLGPAQNNQITVRETLTIFFHDQPLTELPARELVLTQGTQEIQNSIPLPHDAAEGPYRVMTTVEPVAVPNARKGQASARFVVTAATPKPAATGATLAPGSRASLAPEAARPPGTPQMIYIKNEVANLRDGAGASFRVIGTVPRGTRLTVISEAGPEQSKWYKVKLADGREAWVASSVVTTNP
jgi:hypothetical protein